MMPTMIHPFPPKRANLPGLGVDNFPRFPTHNTQHVCKHILEFIFVNQCYHLILLDSPILSRNLRHEFFLTISFCCSISLSVYVHTDFCGTFLFRRTRTRFVFEKSPNIAIHEWTTVVLKWLLWRAC